MLKYIFLGWLLGLTFILIDRATPEKDIGPIEPASYLEFSA